MGPPRASIGIVGWLRKNLFSTWYNTLLTIISFWVIYSVGSQLLVWAFTSARWGIIPANLRLFMVGPYPPDQVWRVWLVLIVVSLMMGLSAGVWGGTMRTFGVWLAAAYVTLAVLPFDGTGRLWLIANLAMLVAAFVVSRGRAWLSRYLLAFWILSFVFTMVLLQGFADILLPVGTSQWGGLLLTFIFSVVSIVLSFPLGVLLALGRRSQLPVVKIFSILYIELIRGVPLVTVLYMGQLMLPLFLPTGIRVDNVVRAIAAFTLFTAAYMAENVRGGLQAIPEGQIEAGMAIGLNNALVTFLIVLPQALRMVIPTTVGLFISLFKDTTLATIVAQLELLGVARSVLAQPEFLGRQTEVYVFVAAVFFIFCYAMSFASYRLEEALGVGKR
jgi:general L-amino acid transport system permease protein